MGTISLCRKLPSVDSFLLMKGSVNKCPRVGDTRLHDILASKQLILTIQLINV